MSSRREARIRAFQLLFQVEFSIAGVCSAQERERLTCHLFFGGREFDPYSLRLYYGVISELAEIDACIRKYTEHWKIERIGKIDLTLLRLGIYELLHCPDVPPATVINEAIELAKVFGEAESPSFINGILDQVAKKEVRCLETMERVHGVA